MEFVLDDNTTLRRNTTLQNVTLPEDVLSDPPKIIALVIVTWIILANGHIALCFIFKGQDLWTSYSRQVLNLSINDLLLGIASLLNVLIGFIQADVGNITCSVSFYLFFSAQCACLYNILVICIHRSLSIIRKTKFKINLRFSALMICMAWSVSFLLLALPFLVWRNKQSMSICTIMSVINDQKPSIVVFAAYTLPLVLTNILYLAVALKIFTHLRKVVPVLTAPENVSNGSDQRQKNMFRNHWRAFGTVGILLIILDISTMPFIWTLVHRRAGGGMPSRDVRYYVSCAFLLNSGLNPFVYAGRSKPLRDAIKRSWTNLF